MNSHSTGFHFEASGLTLMTRSHLLSKNGTIKSSTSAAVLHVSSSGPRLTEGPSVLHSVTVGTPVSFNCGSWRRTWFGSFHVGLDAPHPHTHTPKKEKDLGRINTMTQQKREFSLSTLPTCLQHYTERAVFGTVDSRPWWLAKPKRSLGTMEALYQGRYRLKKLLLVSVHQIPA